HSSTRTSNGWNTGFNGIRSCPRNLCVDGGNESLSFEKPRELPEFHPIVTEDRIQRLPRRADYSRIEGIHQRSRYSHWSALELLVQYVDTLRIDDKKLKVHFADRVYDRLVDVRVAEAVADHHQAHLCSGEVLAKFLTVPAKQGMLVDVDRFVAAHNPQVSPHFQARPKGSEKAAFWSRSCSYRSISGRSLASGMLGMR